MRNFLLTVLIFFSSIVHGEVEYVRKIELLHGASSESEITQHLIHLAVWEVILERSTELKFDSSILSSRVQERFNSYLSQQPSRSDHPEVHRECEYVKYLHLISLLDSFKIKNLEKSQNGALNYEVQFILNRFKLDRFLNRFLNKNDQLYKHLFLISEIELIGLGWKELGLENAENFNAPLRSSLVDLAQSTVPVEIEDIKECSGVCLEDFQQWIKTPLKNGQLDVEHQFHRSLLLKVSFTLKKNSFRSNLGEIDLEWEGNFLLLDGNTKMPIYASSIPQVRKTFRHSDLKALNSAIAGHMYRDSKNLLQRIDIPIRDSKRFSRLTPLILTGHTHLGDVLLLIEKLTKDGRLISLNLQIDLLTQKEVRVLAFYQGEEKSFTDLLSQLKELKSLHNYKIESEPSEVGFTLKFVAD